MKTTKAHALKLVQFDISHEINLPQDQLNFFYGKEEMQ